jgi:beta-glucanase (GH16 family)
VRAGIALVLAGLVSASSLTACSGGSDDDSPSVRLTISTLPFQNTSVARDATSGEATFTPSKPGAKARLQVSSGTAWRTVSSGRQDSGGTFSFTVRRSTSASRYRAVSQSADGKQLTSSVETVSQDWHKVWADEFKGDSLDPAKWATRVQPRTGRRLCSSPASDLVDVQDGHAVLGIERVGSPTKVCPHGVFENAMIGTGEVTDPGFHAKYGLFAARVKFQSGRGQHGSFWMQGAGAGSAEIDVAEYFGDNRSDGGISSFVHRTAADGTVSSVGGMRAEVPKALGKRHTPSNGWHVWSVEWSPKGYVFRVDDTVTMRSSRGSASVPEFLVLSLLTSDWELSALDTTKSTMKVDWVRAWQH